MSFSNEWETIYSNNQQLSIFPWSDLVSYVNRFCKPYKKPFKVLELGCGAGANIPFFNSIEDVQYFGIEGSSTIVDSLHKKFPDHINNIISGDFSKTFFFKNKFNLIIDRASITHNTTNAVLNIKNLIYNSLEDDGLFIGIDWFSTLHSGFNYGNYVDSNTKVENLLGPFAGVGNVHFSDKEHLLSIFKEFEFIKLEHKIHNYLIPQEDNIWAAFNFVLRKK